MRYVIVVVLVLGVLGCQSTEPPETLTKSDMAVDEDLQSKDMTIEDASTTEDQSAPDLSDMLDLADLHDLHDLHDAQLDMPPPTPLMSQYPLPGDALYPESVAFDPVRRAFFVGSLEKGNVLRIAADGQVEEFFAGTGEANQFTLGVKVDVPRDRLIVCSYLNEKPVTGRLWLFDLTSKQRTHDIDLTEVAPNGSCSDIDFNDDGVIYVTDREMPHIYRITASANGQYTQELWAKDDLLAPPTVGVGQNGAALTPDQKVLLTTRYFPPKFWRVAVDDPTDVREVRLIGDITSRDVFAGADGIVMVEGDLYVALGKSLLRLRSDDDWLTAWPKFVDVGTSIAAVTYAEGALYILKSDIPKFVLGGQPDLPFALQRVELTAFD